MQFKHRKIGLQCIQFRIEHNCTMMCAYRGIKMPRTVQYVIHILTVDIYQKVTFEV